jgi:hypothetical protein
LQDFESPLDFAAADPRHSPVQRRRRSVDIEMPRGFTFILNPLNYTGVLPQEVISGISFDKADVIQTATIRDFLVNQGTILGQKWSIYFTKPSPPGSRYQYEPLHPSEVRFWVLNFEETSLLHDLETAFLLTEPDLEWGVVFHVPPERGGIGIDMPKLFHFWQTNLLPVVQDVDRDILAEAAAIHDQIKGFAPQREDPSRASVLRILADFQSSRSYIRLGHLALLSDFSLIEAILTHEPSPVAGDSLNHQISTKMPLVSRRFARPLQPHDFFDDLDEVTLWKRLYKVRSLFAHGDVPDFKKGNLVPLRSFDSVQPFVRIALKRLLKLALREPRLVFDLKSC